MTNRYRGVIAAANSSFTEQSVMINDYRAGIPGNGKPFPEGSKMAKVHFNLKKMETFPAATAPDAQHASTLWRRIAKIQDSSGWGYGAFEYDAGSAKQGRQLS